MNLIQMGAAGGVVLILLVKLVPWSALKNWKPSKTNRDPLKTTLEQCAPLLDTPEDFESWKRLVDLADEKD